MFGYVRPAYAELKMREWQQYQAVYCGLCREMGAQFGQMCRVSLSHDVTALAVMLLAAGDDAPEHERFRCATHPFKIRAAVADGGALRYAAGLNVLLAEGQARDAWRDERKLSGGAGVTALHAAARRAGSLYPDAAAAITAKLAQLSSLEKAQCANPDEAAEPFAQLLAALFADAPGAKGAADEKAWRVLGYYLGKWIYWTDAWDDLEKDAATGQYNCFLRQGGLGAAGKEAAARAKSYKSEKRQAMEEAFTQVLARASQAKELIRWKRWEALADNILYLGCAQQTERVLSGEGAVAVDPWHTWPGDLGAKAK